MLLETVTGLESTYMTAIDGMPACTSCTRNSQSHLQIPEGLSVPWDDTLLQARALDEGRMYTDDVADCWGDSDAARALGIATCQHPDPRRGRPPGRHPVRASDQRKPLAEDAAQVLRMCSQLIGQQVERERLLQEYGMRTGAGAQRFTDSATGLPSRRALMDELGRRLAQQRNLYNELLVASSTSTASRRSTTGTATGRRSPAGA